MGFPRQARRVSFVLALAVAVPGGRAFAQVDLTGDLFLDPHRLQRVDEAAGRSEGEAGQQGDDRDDPGADGQAEQATGR